MHTLGFLIVDVQYTTCNRDVSVNVPLHVGDQKRTLWFVSVSFCHVIYEKFFSLLRPSQPSYVNISAKNYLYFTVFCITILFKLFHIHSIFYLYLTSVKGCSLQDPSE